MRRSNCSICRASTSQMQRRSVTGDIVVTVGSLGVERGTGDGGSTAGDSDLIANSGQLVASGVCGKGTRMGPGTIAAEAATTPRPAPRIDSSHVHLLLGGCGQVLVGIAVPAGAALIASAIGLEAPRMTDASDYASGIQRGSCSKKPYTHHPLPLCVRVCFTIRALTRQS